MKLQTIYQNFNNALTDTEGKSVFVVGYEAESYLMVLPGDYVMIIFTNDPDVPKDFALVMASQRGVNLQLK